MVQTELRNDGVLGSSALTVVLVPWDERSCGELGQKESKDVRTANRIPDCRLRRLESRLRRRSARPSRLGRAPLPDPPTYRRSQLRRHRPRVRRCWRSGSISRCAAASRVFIAGSISSRGQRSADADRRGGGDDGVLTQASRYSPIHPSAWNKNSANLP